MANMSGSNAEWRSFQNYNAPSYLSSTSTAAVVRKYETAAISHHHRRRLTLSSGPSASVPAFMGNFKQPKTRVIFVYPEPEVSEISVNICRCRFVFEVEAL
jgi:hypothetical protein